MSDSLLKKRMKTKKDIERIIIKNMKSGLWCKSECKKALKYLEQFKDNDTIDTIAENIPEKWALEWAFRVGDKELMKKLIHTEKYALKWACWISDREYMKQFIYSDEYAYYWALNIGDREYMKQFIENENWAFYWAADIGDMKYMSQFIKSKYWKDRWKIYWGSD